MFWNWMLQSKEFKPENFNTSAITSPSNYMLQNKRFTGEITENFAHQSPRGNMYKLLDCLRTPLKRFLACLTFHRKEIRLRHLHKRSNPGSAPVTSNVKALLTASTIISYHIVPQVICEMWNIWACSKHRSSRPEVFCKKGVLRNFTKFTGRHLYQSLLFNKVAGLRPATLLKKRLWHKSFPVNFVIFLRILFFIKYIWWLLLKT